MIQPKTARKYAFSLLEFVEAIQENCKVGIPTGNCPTNCRGCEWKAKYPMIIKTMTFDETILDAIIEDLGDTPCKK